LTHAAEAFASQKFAIMPVYGPVLLPLKGLIMNKETHANYKYVLAYLAPRYRLVECNANYQWIIQKQDKNGTRWRNQSFFIFKEPLQKQCTALGLNIEPLSQLPDRFVSQYEAVQNSESQNHEEHILKFKKQTVAKDFLKPNVLQQGSEDGSAA